ncbi:MAG TPA: MFS transporter [Candidatus Angelobacter sp.]|nr:MFS transporter [Candidatus Angelobacter sp.]
MASTVTLDSTQPSRPAHPLRDPQFRMLWIGSAISLLGDQFYLVALPWVILQLTGSALAMGTIMMLAAVPRAVLMLLGGVVSDRFSPRRILISTSCARTIFVAAISVLLWFHVLAVWHLYLLAFAFGTADAFTVPASSTYLPFLVKKDQLVAANSLFQSTAQFTTITAPAPAGLIVKAFGAAWAFVADAISFLAIIAALWKLPDPPAQALRVGRPSMWQSIREGFGYVYRDLPLRSLILLVAVINFCIAGPMNVGLAYLTKQKFGSAAAFGIAMSALAAGGLLGSLLAGIWKPKRRGVLMLSVCVELGLCIASIGLLHVLWALAGVLLLMGMSASLMNIHIISWIQQRIEPAMMGRVMSVLMFFSLGLMPLSLATTGLALQWSLIGTFLIAGGTLVVVTLTGALQPSVRRIE